MKEEKEKGRPSKGGMVFDIFFELILILLVLFTAMMLSQGDVIGGPYTVNVPKTILTLGLIAFYLGFVIYRSNTAMDASMRKLRAEMEAEKREAEQ